MNNRSDENVNKPPLIILTGPTAAGKTALSIALAKRIGGQILSADSMQVYRRMDIGTAKVTPEEMQGIPHYLIDVLEPEEEFHVVRFQQMAKEALRKIYKAGAVPIVAGGTGFYIQALLYDIDFQEQPEDTAYRRELWKLSEEKGPEYLHGLLEQADPEAAAAIHPHNVKRIIRALEYNRQTGGRISEHNAKQREKESPYRFLYFVLNDHRQALYDRIDRRVDHMIEQGLVEEVRSLYASGCNREMVSMQGLGYKEIIRYLEGELTLSEATAVIKRETRHFAKRQLTWFKHERQVVWLFRPDYPGEEQLLQHMEAMIREQNLLND